MPSTTTTSGLACPQFDTMHPIVGGSKSVANVIKSKRESARLELEVAGLDVLQLDCEPEVGIWAVGTRDFPRFGSVRFVRVIDGVLAFAENSIMIGVDARFKAAVDDFHTAFPEPPRPEQVNELVSKMAYYSTAFFWQPGVMCAFITCLRERFEARGE